MAINSYKHATPAGAGAKNGNDWANAFGEAELEAFLEGTVVAGDVIFVAGGTYVFDSSYDWSARDGTQTAPIAIIGVKAGTTHEGAAVVYSDWARATADMPLFDMATFTLVPSDLNMIRNIWFQGSATNMIYLNATYGTTFENCKFENDSAVVGTFQIMNVNGPGCTVLNCEITGPNTNASALVVNGLNFRAYYCYFHDLNSAGIAINFAASYGGIYNSVFDTVGTAIRLGTYYNDAINNTIYSATTGISIVQSYNIIANNLIDTTSVAGIAATVSQKDHIVVWGNHGSDARCTDMWSNVDTTTVFQDYAVTAGDPLFTNAAGGDLSINSSSPCLGTAADIALGVGAVPSHGNKGASQAGRAAPTYAAVGNVLSGVDRGDGTLGTRVDADPTYYVPTGPVYGDPTSPISGAADLPALNKVAPTDSLLGSAGTMDLPALNKVAPSDTLEGVPGTLDLPAINKVAPSDTLEGVAGTLDLPALSGVDPLDTLEGVPGTMDVPALSSIDPADTLRGVPGTIDLPALSSVDPLDTLKGAPGTMDLPAITAILSTDTLRNVAGRWIKADPTKYQNGETYGIDGTSETGTYIPAAVNLAIRNVVPSFGPVAGGNQAEVRLNMSQAATAVSFGGVAATILSQDGAVVTVTVPAGAATGAVDVVVNTAIGSDTYAGAYDYTPAASIVARITAHIKSTLHGLNTYGGAVTAEEERMLLDINDRYPYLQIVGPEADVDGQTTFRAYTELRYTLFYFVDGNDESRTRNTELPYLTRNVHADIVKALMIDETRGGLAQKTQVEGHGSLWLTDEEKGAAEFCVFVNILVKSVGIDNNDPYLLG